MNKKLLSFYIITFLSFFAIVAQNEKVPNKPNDIRLLPEDYKEGYQSDDYDYIESVSLFTKFKIWFFQKIVELLELDPEGANFVFNLIKKIVLFFFIVLFIFIIYFLMKMILGKEARWLFKRKQTKDVDLDYAIDQDIQSVDFGELIEKAVKNEDYRLAIKYHYFYLLKKLDEASIIKYDPQKTTYDYQLDLEGTKHTTVFSKAAYYYTYIWYGEFSIDANEYQMTSNTFTQLLKTLKDE